MVPTATGEGTLKPGVKQGLFLRIEEFSRRRYGLVFLVTLLLVVVSLFLGTRLSLDGDVLNLAPRNNRIVDTFREAIEDFGSLDYLLVLVEARDGQGVEDLQAFADLLADGMCTLPSVIYVEHKIDTSSPLFAFLRRNQTLFLPREKIPELAAKFSDQAIRDRVRENYSQLTGPSSFLAKRILEQDPFLISPLLIEAVMRSKGPLRFDLNGGYFLSKDGGALLLIDVYCIIFRGNFHFNNSSTSERSEINHNRSALVYSITTLAQYHDYVKLWFRLILLSAAFF